MRTKLTVATSIVALVFAFSLAGCSDDDTAPSTEISCVDGIDNDLDGDIDCDDLDCAADVACFEYECEDGLDDDNDGLTDCDDPDCDADVACQGPECGDDFMEGTEECDGMDFGGATCQSLGWDTGTLTCDSYCMINDMDCDYNATCGDNIAEGSEECDGDDPGSLANATCADYGFDGGYLMCAVDCTADISACRNELDTCTDVGTDSLAVAGTVTCADETTTLDWDWYTVPVLAGDCIHIKADNGTGAADLMAWAIDPDGVTVYGGAGDFSQLDDEWTCTVAPWDDYDCPEASVLALTDGDMTILIGQWAGGCATGMSDYTLWVAVNATDVTPTLAQDDTPMP